MKEPEEPDMSPAPAEGAAEVPIEVDTQMVLINSHAAQRQRLPWTLYGVRAFFGLWGTIAPKSAGRIAARMFMKPRRHHTPRREARWLRQSERRDYDLENHTIATYWWGRGPVVLLAHGWEGRGSQLGAFVEPLVEAGYCVVALDLPAHGHSSGKSTDAFTCGRVMRALCDKIGGVYGAVAHSFGGTAVLLAMSQGLRLERTVLISPGVVEDTFFTGFAKIVGLPERATDELRRVIYGLFGHEDWSVFTTQRLGEVLGARSGAAMVLHDIGDAEVAYTESVELVHWAKGARLLSTRGVGHRRILRDALVVQNAAAFISGGE
jgi:pimeloyl-ACP methyl ester carboxylesterase